MSGEDGLIRRVFIDADSGDVLLNYVDMWTQFAVGRGTGVLGDSKKVIALPSGGGFLAVDSARPRTGASDLPAGQAITFDLRGNLSRWLSLSRPTPADIAADADNVWTDAGVVDAHAHTGLTYDFVFRRFGRSGVDGNNRQVWTFVNLVRPEDHVTLFNDFPNYFTNAAYTGGGRVYFGVGLPPGVVRGGRTWLNLAGALDVVAHELTHAITDFTSDLIYLNESGALNEAFSDIVGASVEWFYQAEGSAAGAADWLIGEDIARPRGFRSMSDPASYGAPDHYSRRVTGTADNGGVHTNSSIVNHMYYLAVNGGTHRLSGVTVAGIGFANRDRAERVVFRAFTALMPAGATFATARAATIQAAQDLYGAGSAEAIAFAQAWTAVGVG
jgi:thermolysin